MSTAEPLEITELKAAGPTRFHLSLNVSDLERTIDFFRVFFGVEPAKQRVDYAKFELDDPPLVLSLEPVGSSRGGNLNHLGFRLSSVAALVGMQRRLESRGISTQREEGVECCYARQTKFWLHDPDGNLWEVYTLDDDIEHRGMPPQMAGGAAMHFAPLTHGAPGNCAPAAESAPAPAVWMHRIGQPLPAQLFVQDGSVDEARLQGTFNLRCDAVARRRVLSEVLRALRPGGRVLLHTLTADRELPDQPLDLPGPASVVEVAPLLSELVRELEQAGFADLRFEKLADSPCFSRLGAELRETKLSAQKPGSAGARPMRRLCYKGPLAEVRLEGGQTLRRGEFTAVDEATYNLLRESARDQFVFSPSTTS
jgi:catechol 2,3-dioxygenase-like lactoylglutathione lyase family enzyme